MKRIAVIAAAAVGLGAGLTACGGQSPNRGEADLVIWADAIRTGALEAPLKAWAEKNGLTAVVQTVATDLQSNFVTANEAKNGPDVVIGAQDWTGKLVQNSAIVPIQISAEGVSQAAIDAVSYGGQTYGAPYAIETLGLFVNNALTDNAAPATIEDMVAAGQAGSAENVLCLQVGESGDAYHMQPLFTSGGGYIFGTNADGSFNTADVGVGSAGGIEAAKKIGELGAEGVLKNSINGDNSLQLFNDGKCAYLVSGPWALAGIREAGLDFTLSPIPGFAGLDPAEPPLGVQAFFVASNAKSPAFAQQFVNDLLADTTITRAMNNSDARVPTQDALAEQLKASDPILMQFLDLAQSAKAMPNIPAMEAVWSPLGQAEAAVVGGADPASTFEAAGKEIASSVQ
ncbi:MAG: extracellular solute-binding protein [Bifidobacteriaceae bacterium]|jgi:arabinogalactan oligomer/maltooligosaccharide transport system substrate-binding protein|nr:extracellular solute-binding protein [Bifidobacteriaceae bacterium]